MAKQKNCLCVCRDVLVIRAHAHVRSLAHHPQLCVYLNVLIKIVLNHPSTAAPQRQATAVVSGANSQRFFFSLSLQHLF